MEVADVRRRRTAKWEDAADGQVAVGLAEMDVAVPDVVAESVREALDRQELGYSPRDRSGLAAAFSEFVGRRFGWSVEVGETVLVPDVLEGVLAALRYLLPPGPVVLTTPSYPPFFSVLEISGRAVDPVPLVYTGRSCVLDLPAIDAALRRGARVVLLTNPQNPTGRCFERAELLELADVVSRRDARVLADEVHAPLTYEPARHVPYASVSATAREHSVTVTSASKGWNLAGLKCSQLVLTSAADRATWSRLSPFAVPGVSPLGIVAHEAAYSKGEPWLDELLRRLRDKRDLLVGACAASSDLYLPAGVPEATYLLWVASASCAPESSLAEQYRRAHGVLAADGSNFGAGHAAAARINYAAGDEVLERVAQCLRGYPPPSPHPDSKETAGR